MASILLYACLSSVILRINIVNKIVLSHCSLTASISADPGSLTVGEFLKFRSLILFHYYSIHLLRTPHLRPQKQLSLSRVAGVRTSTHNTLLRVLIQLIGFGFGFMRILLYLCSSNQSLHRPKLRDFVCNNWHIQ